MHFRNQKNAIVQFMISVKKKIEQAESNGINDAIPILDSSMTRIRKL